MTVHIMVSCLIQVEWEVDLGESLSKHFAECVYMCAVGVLEFQALGSSVCSKTGGQLDSLPDHLNTWNSHHRPTAVFILFYIVLHFCFCALCIWSIHLGGHPGLRSSSWPAAGLLGGLCTVFHVFMPR